MVEVDITLEQSIAVIIMKEIEVNLQTRSRAWSNWALASLGPPQCGERAFVGTSEARRKNADERRLIELADEKKNPALRSD